MPETNVSPALERLLPEAFEELDAVQICDIQKGTGAHATSAERNQAMKPSQSATFVLGIGLLIGGVIANCGCGAPEQFDEQEDAYPTDQIVPGDHSSIIELGTAEQAFTSQVHHGGVIVSGFVDGTDLSPLAYGKCSTAVNAFCIVPGSKAININVIRDSSVCTAAQAASLLNTVAEQRTIYAGLYGTNGWSFTSSASGGNVIIHCGHINANCAGNGCAGLDNVNRYFTVGSGTTSNLTESFPGSYHAYSQLITTVDVAALEARYGSGIANRQRAAVDTGLNLAMGVGQTSNSAVVGFVANPDISSATAKGIATGAELCQARNLVAGGTSFAISTSAGCAEPL